MHPFNIVVHVTAYQDSAALARVLAAILAQTCSPTLIRVVDNSPAPLGLPESLREEPESVARIEYLHLPSNVGTAGAINRSIAWAAGYEITPQMGHETKPENFEIPAIKSPDERERVRERERCGNRSGSTRADFLWVLDQDSVPAPELLGELISAHQRLAKTAAAPVGIVAPLTRNRDDGQPNRPMRFDRYRSEPVLYTTEPMECDFLPASGMVLHLPSLTRLQLPADAYFLDIYDFALGLAVKAAGAGVWLVPSLELSHQVGRKVTVADGMNSRTLADMPVSRVELVHRNTTYLYTRSAVGFDKVLAAGWQGRRAILQSWRFIYFGVDHSWAKVAAALTGWCGGLWGLKNREL